MESIAWLNVRTGNNERSELSSELNEIMITLLYDDDNTKQPLFIFLFDCII